MTATSERFDVAAERRRLGAMTAGELRQRYQEIGGEEVLSDHPSLVRDDVLAAMAHAAGSPNLNVCLSLSLRATCLW